MTFRHFGSVFLLSTCILTSQAASFTSTADLTAEAEADLINNLPGLDFLTNYRQFSGYLDAGDDTFLHYWFIESESSPSSDPLLLWLNGGPGCSSLDGLLNELGPFHINDDSKTLYNNSYSWNSFANIVYLESPACVGFSYNKRGDCSASDDKTSMHNYEALKQFFAKFPQYRNNPFFVTGESYGGVYIPTLAVRLVEGNASFPMNFKGFAVGNGLSNDQYNDNSIIFFANYHGLLGKELWQGLVDHCCKNDVPTQDSCDFSNSFWPICRVKVEEAVKIIFDGGLNMYNLYSDCLVPNLGATHNKELSRYHTDRYNVFRNFYKQPANGLLGLDPPCTDSHVMTNYLNNPDVRRALHIPDFVPKFDICNDEVNHGYQRQYRDMKQQYLQLNRAGIRGLVYNGDVDMACNFIGDQWFVEGLGLKEIEMRRAWKSGSQIGGFLKRFEGLDLATVRGSGHMVPQDKPLPSLDLTRAFVLNQRYP